MASGMGSTTQRLPVRARRLGFVTLLALLFAGAALNGLLSRPSILLVGSGAFIALGVIIRWQHQRPIADAVSANAVPSRDHMRMRLTRAHVMASLLLGLTLLTVWLEGALHMLLDGALWSRSVWLLQVAGVGYTLVRVIPVLRELIGF